MGLQRMEKDKALQMLQDLLLNLLFDQSDRVSTVPEHCSGTVLRQLRSLRITPSPTSVDALDRLYQGV
jgi:hypothetical protein